VIVVDCRDARHGVALLLFLGFWLLREVEEEERRGEEGQKEAWDADGREKMREIVPSAGMKWSWVCVGERRSWGCTYNSRVPGQAFLRR